MPAALSPLPSVSLKLSSSASRRARSAAMLSTRRCSGVSLSPRFGPFGSFFGLPLPRPSFPARPSSRFLSSFSSCSREAVRASRMASCLARSCSVVAFRAALPAAFSAATSAARRSLTPRTVAARRSLLIWFLTSCSFLASPLTASRRLLVSALNASCSIWLALVISRTLVSCAQFAAFTSSRTLACSTEMPAFVAALRASCTFRDAAPIASASSWASARVFLRRPTAAPPAVSSKVYCSRPRAIAPARSRSANARSLSSSAFSFASEIPALARF